MFPLVIYLTSENNVKYAIQKIKSNVSIVKCFHCQMFPLSNVSIVKCFHCERSIQGLCLLVKHDEAKDVQYKDIVIDPLFPAGSLVPDNVQTNPSPYSFYMIYCCILCI